jgi:hypothetical protein
LINGNGQETLWQNDKHSCGLFIIRHACYQILGLPVYAGAVGRYDSEELRAEAISLLYSVWTNNVLVVMSELLRRKRKGQAGERGRLQGTGKRQKAGC